MNVNWLRWAGPVGGAVGLAVMMFGMPRMSEQAQQHAVTLFAMFGGWYMAILPCADIIERLQTKLAEHEQRSVNAKD